MKIINLQSWLKVYTFNTEITENYNLLKAISIFSELEFWKYSCPKK